MKKQIAALLAIILLFSLTACKGGKGNTSDTSSAGETKEAEHIPYDYDLSPYITLGEYKGITYVPLSTEPTEEGIWDRVVETLLYCGLYEKEVYPDRVTRDLTEGNVMVGDLVLLDITTESDGKTVDGGTGKKLATEVGANLFTSQITAAESETAGFDYAFLTQFLTDVEKAAVGKEIGVSFTLTGTFPEDNFDDSLVGKPYTLTVTVTKVGKRYGHPDALTESEIALFGDYEDQAACFEGIRDILTQNGFDPTDDEVWHYITYGFEQSGYYNTTLYDDCYKENLTSGTVRNGDTVYISYEGTVDGKKLDNACSDGTTLVIGSGSYIDGFETGLIGCEIGSTTTLDLTFPDPYPNNTALSGKPVSFKTTVHLVTKRYEHPDTLPAIIMQELYEQEMSPSTDFADLWEQMKQEEKTTLENEALDSQNEQVIAKITENATLLSLPEDEVLLMMQNIETSQEQQAAYYGYDLETYLMLSQNMTYEQFTEACRAEAEMNVFNMMIVYQIARNEGFDKLDESEYEERAKGYVEIFNMASYADLCDTYGYYQVREAIYCDMVTELILAESVAVEE